MKKVLESKLLKNIITLIQGNLFASTISLINVIILARTIGLEKNGMIFMAQTYTNLFNDIFNFQSFNAIIKFVPININNNEKVTSYIKQGIILDILTAFIGLIIGVIALNPIAELMHWDNNMILYTNICLFTILFRVTGTATGILRIFEKFKDTVKVNLFESITRLILYSFGAFINENVLYFIIVDLIITILTMVILNYFAYRELKSRELNNVLKGAINFDNEFIKFNFYSNLQTVLDLPVWHLTPFIINNYLGFSDISVYKIVEKIGSIISKITIPVSTAIHPYISREISEGKVKNAFRLHNKIKVATFSIGVIIIILVFTTHGIWLDWIIPDNDRNLLILILYLIYTILTNAFIAQHAIFIYLGYIKLSIPILIIGNISYIILLYVLTQHYGLIGIMISRIFQSSIISLMKYIVLNLKNIDYSKEKFLNEKNY